VRLGVESPRMGQGLSRNKSNATYFEADQVGDELLGLLLYVLQGRFRVRLTVRVQRTEPRRGEGPLK
jgi:hypothetical protein